jgi:hypothetical protein
MVRPIIVGRGWAMQGHGVVKQDKTRRVSWVFESAASWAIPMVVQLGPIFADLEVDVHGMGRTLVLRC